MLIHKGGEALFENKLPLETELWDWLDEEVFKEICIWDVGVLVKCTDEVGDDGLDEAGIAIERV